MAVRRWGENVLNPIGAECAERKKRRFECIVCRERTPLEATSITSQCTHSRNVCRTCVARTIEMEIDSKGNAVNLVCPSPGCGAELTLEDASREASQEVATRLNTLLLQRALSELPNFFWCAHRDCENGQLVSEFGKNVFMTCSACGRRTCTHHRSIWHSERSCDQHDQDQAEDRESQLPLYKVVRSTRYYYTPSLEDKAAKVAECGSFVKGLPEGNHWVKVGDLYIPVTMRGHEVLLPQKGTYLLDNTKLGSKSRTLKCRASPDLQDIQRDVGNKRKIKWGSFVQGVRINENWVQAGETYLPVCIRGVQVLRLQSELSTFLDEKGVVRCPRCRHGIEKNSGCDHIRCHCGAEFCFICGADYGGPEGIFSVGNHAHKKSCKWYM